MYIAISMQYVMHNYYYKYSGYFFLAVVCSDEDDMSEEDQNFCLDLCDKDSDSECSQF